MHDNRPIRIPHGLVHHWIGTIFIPGATLPQTMSLMENYPSYSQLFSFGVERSKVLSQDKRDFEVQLRMFREARSPVFYNVDPDDRYIRVDAGHGYRRSRQPTPGHTQLPFSHPPSSNHSKPRLHRDAS